MPENVTRFQPPENVKKSLIRWTHIDIMPSRLPTFFHEEPQTPLERRWGLLFWMDDVAFDRFTADNTV